MSFSEGVSTSSQPVICYSQTSVNDSRTSRSELEQMRQTKFYDILLVYHVLDSELAKEYKHHLEKHEKLKLVNGRSIDVLLCEEIPAGTLQFQPYNTFIGRCTFTFLLLTKEFCDEKVHQLLSETVLINSLQDDDQCWSVVPVFNGPKRQKNIKPPFILSALRGLDLSSRDDFALENMQTLINTRCFIRDRRETDFRTKLKAFEKQVEEEEEISHLKLDVLKLNQKHEHGQRIQSLRSCNNYYSNNNSNNNPMGDSMQHYLHSEIPQNVLQPTDKTDAYCSKRIDRNTDVQSNSNTKLSCGLSSYNMSNSLNNSIDDEFSLNTDKLSEKGHSDQYSIDPETASSDTQFPMCNAATVDMGNRASTTLIKHSIMPSNVDHSARTLPTHGAYDTITASHKLNGNPCDNITRTISELALGAPTDICSKTSQSTVAPENVCRPMVEYVNMDLINAHLSRRHTDPDFKKNSPNDDVQSGWDFHPSADKNNHLNRVTKTDTVEAQVDVRLPLKSLETDESLYHSCSESSASCASGKPPSSESSKEPASHAGEVHHHHHYYHHYPDEAVSGSQRQSVAESSKPRTEERDTGETNKQVFILKNSSLHIGAKTVITSMKRSKDSSLDEDGEADEVDDDEADGAESDAEELDNPSATSAEIDKECNRVVKSEKTSPKKRRCIIS